MLLVLIVSPFDQITERTDLLPSLEGSGQPLIQQHGIDPPVCRRSPSTTIGFCCNRHMTSLCMHSAVE